MNVVDKVEQISTDFYEQRGPFDDVEFPEERLLQELKVRVGDTDEPSSLSKEDRLKVISAFATMDYNRDANQLVDNLLELHDRKPKWFDAYGIPASQQTVKEVFTDIGFRYGSRDARGWYHNNSILRDEYHGEWTELLLSVGTDAPSLVERLEEDNFLYLKGVKIAPMYARIINDEVCELDNLWELEIPVDTHVRRLSQDLFDSPDMSDDEIRREWRVLSEANIERQTVDGALWHIGNKWNDWGKDYWEQL